METNSSLRRHRLHTWWKFKPYDNTTDRQKNDLERELTNTHYNLKYIAEDVTVDVWVVFDDEAQEALFKLTYL